MHSSYLMLHYFVWQQTQRVNVTKQGQGQKSRDKKVRFIGYDAIYPPVPEHVYNDNITDHKKNNYTNTPPNINTNPNINTTPPTLIQPLMNN